MFLLVNIDLQKIILSIHMKESILNSLRSRSIIERNLCSTRLLISLIMLKIEPVTSVTREGIIYMDVMISIDMAHLISILIPKVLPNIISNTS